MADMLELKLNYVKLSERYSGMWIAIHPESEEVFAPGSTATGVPKVARDLGAPEPIVTKVVDDYGSCIFRIGRYPAFLKSS